ncbi:MAG: PQQ-binding-like beta-propeller repeat protein [Pirellulales bacterium]
MSKVESSPPAPPRLSVPRRMWIPIAALALSAVGMIGLGMLPSDRLAVGDRRLYSFILAAAGFLAVGAWFFFGSGVSRRARAASAVVVGGVVLFLVLGVRRVEFSGDMDPTFDFRWTPDRFAVLEQHRAQQRADGGLAPIRVEVVPDDVWEYRGERRDGIIPGPKLARDWSAKPPRLVWRQPVGGGYASFVVVGPTLITIEQRRDQEAVVAYDADTGIERWVYEYPALFHETLGGDGPRGTPTFHDGKLYALGATGVLSCLDFVTGKPLWSFNILNENECGNLDWAMSGSPLVYDDVVLVNPGNQKGSAASRSIVAYALADGKRRFAGGESRAGYASPMLVTLAGARQLLIFDAVGLAGFDAADGRELWRVPWKSEWDINASQPIVVDDDRVFFTSTSGGALVRIGQTDGRWSAVDAWRNRNMKCGYASPILYQGHVYGIDENMLACVDVSTGKRLWKARGGQYGHGQILLRDDLLVVLSEAGELALVEASPERFKELGRMPAIEGKTWNVPVLVGKRIFVRNHLEMAAYDLPTEKAEGRRQKAEGNDP